MCGFHTLLCDQNAIVFQKSYQLEHIRTAYNRVYLDPNVLTRNTVQVHRHKKNY